MIIIVWAVFFHLFSERLTEQNCCRQLHARVPWKLKATDHAILYLMALGKGLSRNRKRDGQAAGVREAVLSVPFKIRQPGGHRRDVEENQSGAGSEGMTTNLFSSGELVETRIVPSGCEVAS